ncbi:MAG TPA: efflux RND transporter permease subunit [Candidatus Sulfomarinibacteraceae bacterium]|nr:efflux RND transporter permease subunit [Candidatus Sulfomarinibacteraceae bacterium]
MVRLTQLALATRSVTLLLAVAIFGAGIFAWGQLRQELVPDVEFPVLTIVSPYPGAGASDVAEQVTKPIERAIGSTSGIESLQSTSSNSLSIVTAQFVFGTDLKETRATVDQALAAVGLPSGVEPKVLVLNINAQPVIVASVRSAGDATLEEVVRIVQSAVIPELSGIDGVASVAVTGGRESRVRIALSVEKLAAAGVSLQQVQGVLAANNVTFPVGQIPIDGVSVPVSALHRFDSVEELQDLVVGVQTGGTGFPGAPTLPGAPGAGAPSAGAPSIPTPVTLGSLGVVEEVQVASTGFSRTGGEPSVSISVSKTADGNTVAVSAAIEAAFEDAEARLGDRIEIQTVYDSSTFIIESRDGLLKEGGLGAVFAVLVIFLFLLNVRSTVVAAVSIPLSLVAALALMLVAGISVNIMTLGGLAVAIGRVVDDAIVVLENIYRHRGRGDDMATAVIGGTREVASAITSSTLTTVAVFLPLGLVGGLISQFFLPFALTVTFALLASLVVALTIVPILAATLLRNVKLQLGPDGEPRETIWQRTYEPLLRLALRNRFTRWGTIVAAFALFAVTSGLLTGLPTQFLNTGSEKFLQISVVPPAGATSEEVIARADDAARLLEADDEVTLTLATIPGEGDTSFQTLAAATAGRPQNSAIIFTRLVSSADLKAATDRLKSILGPIVRDGYSVSVEESSGFGGTSLSLVVTGTDPARIAAASDAILAALADDAELDNLKSDLVRAAPEIQVQVDPNKAILLGLTTAQVGADLRSALTGSPVGRILLNGAPVQLDLRLDAGNLDSAEAIRGLPVGLAARAPLGQIANVEEVETRARVTRVGGQDAATITATIRSENTGAVSRAVTDQVDQLRAAGDLEGVEVSIGGVTRQQNQAFAGLFAAMAVAILLVYVVMVLVFNSLVDPLVIMFSLPLATIGAFPALAITGRPIGISALIGFLMLIGIVVTNAIVLLDLVEQLRHKGMTTDKALVQAGRTRVRPILMTAVATIIALAPLALGFNEGSIIAAELGTVVIGGLISSTLLTLIVIPVIYSLVDGAKVSVRRRFGGGHPVPAE